MPPSPAGAAPGGPPPLTGQPGPRAPGRASGGRGPPAAVRGGTGTYNLGNKQLTVGASNASTTVTGLITGTGGSLVKVGTGTLSLTGASSYTGGTTVNAGVLQGNATGLRGNILNNASVVFDQT